jgi:hypothetical protein
MVGSKNLVRESSFFEGYNFNQTEAVEIMRGNADDFVHRPEMSILFS